jgi:hypothetical protein
MELSTYTEIETHRFNEVNLHNMFLTRNALAFVVVTSDQQFSLCLYS